MASIIKLGFEDNPTSGDYINLIDTTSGYIFQGITAGDPYFDDFYKRSLREVKIKLAVVGSTMQELNNRFGKLNYYPEQSRQFLRPLAGNIGASLDGSWYKYRAAVLTWQLNGTSKIVYWNVYQGHAPLPDNYAQAVQNGFVLEDVELTLLVEASARGDRVYLNNLLHCGDFQLPFDPAKIPFRAGWTFSDATKWTVDTTIVKRGIQSLKCTGGASLTLTSNTISASSGGTAGLGSSDRALPSIAIYLPSALGAGDSITAKLQNFNGTSWVDVSTAANLNSSALTGQWVVYTGPAVTVPNSNYRFLITHNSTQVAYYADAAVWLDPLNDALPVEYISSGGSDQFSTINIYNIQGDTDAPCVTLARGDISNQPCLIYIGGRTIKWGKETPVHPHDLYCNAISASSTGLWNNITAITSVDAGNKKVARNFPWTSSSIPTNRRYDAISRKYVVLAIYAANDSMTNIDKFVVSCGWTSKTFVKTFPTTFVGTGTPGASDYEIAVLGDFNYPRPGTGWSERTDFGGSASWNVYYTYTGSAGTMVGDIAGILMLPAEQFGVLDSGSNSGAFSFTQLISSESTNTSVGRGDPAPGNLIVDAYSVVTGLVVAGAKFKLIPGDMTWATFTASARNATTKEQLTAQPSDLMRLGFFYSPRYSEGVFCQ